MGCFFSFAIILVLLITFVSFASQMQSRADKWNISYRALAKRYGGELLAAGWFSRPSVRFTYASTGVIVNPVESRQHGQYTQILIHWPDAKLRLEIFTRDKDIARKALKGMTECPSGVAEFDERFVTFGTSDEEIRPFLSDGVRTQIYRLDNLLDVPGVYVGIQRGHILIKKPLHIQAYKDLEEFTHLATQLFDQAMLSRAVGIKFVPGDGQYTEAICQICGDSITVDMVLCRRCKTPHHNDCWQYYGSCAIYGCGEEKFIVPKLAPPPPGA